LRRGVIWSALPQANNSPTLGDWAQHDGAIDPSQPLDWFGVAAIGVTPDFYVPLDAIHLDCTRPLANGVATNSNGQAAHETLAAATLAGLFELVERDACAAWLAGSAVARAGTEIAAGDIADRDVQMVLARAAVRRVGVRLYRVPALVDVAVIAAELVDHGENRNGHTHVLGSAARFCPVEAVRAALLEALQTRCTEIAGGRDTIPLTNVEIAGRTRARPLGMASRPGWSGHKFNAAVGGPSCLASLIAAIAAAGYPQIGRTILSPPASVATTVTTFVPGLGFEQRRRRQ
ncbi:MAG: YcaO-like family protein, partial [Polymorphobacter sp.]